MRKRIVLFFSAMAIFAGHQRIAAAQQAQPDFRLAYVLATASYCAYAVGEIDENGNKFEDLGAQRALDCLNAAYAADPRHLGVFKDLSARDVEAYVGPSSFHENAYLAINGKPGVILAFRGTLVPPISPAAGNLPRAALETIKNYNSAIQNGLLTFGADWLNNGNASADQRDRHSGFNKAWEQLKDHLGLDCPSSDCSKFLSFVRSARANDPEKRLFITGHSKGGALAVLATLDMRELAANSPKIETYVFAAAKALTQAGAKSAVSATRDVWRFEQEGDIVPTLPPDGSIWPWTLIGKPAYQHVGRRGLFGSNTEPAFTSSSDGRDTPSDSDRLALFFRDDWVNIVRSWVSGDEGTFGRILNSGEAACRPLVDSHFAVFSSIQKIVATEKSAGPSLRNGSSAASPSEAFFLKGLSKNGKSVMWGYGDWCRLFKLI